MTHLSNLAHIKINFRFCDRSQLAHSRPQHSQKKRVFLIEKLSVQCFFLCRALKFLEHEKEEKKSN
jgi:hypothetical protein